MAKILISTADWNAALACMYSLARKGHSIALLSPNKNTPALYSKYCHQKIITPNERNKEAYLSFVTKLIKTGEYDALIPISDLCTEYFSEQRENLLNYIKILLPTKECIDIARNKDKTYKFCIENSIPIPTTYFPKNLSEVIALEETVNYPCLVKEVKGTGGKGNTYVNNKKELINYFKNSTNKTWPVIQELIKGNFCGFAAVCEKGKILDFFIFEVLRQFPESGGPSIYVRSIFERHIFDICANLLKKLNWTGAIDLDFFVTKKQEFALLEINPRFSGTSFFAYKCGVDLPNSYFKLLINTNHSIETNTPKYNTDILFRFVFVGEIVSCKENVKYLPAFFINFFRKNIYYDFSIKDPMLLLRQIWLAKWYLLNKYR